MESLFYSALESLENIHFLRSNKETKRLENFETILHQFDDSIKDELFVVLGIYPEDYFTLSSSVVFNKLLNFAHKSNDLFLTYYMDIRERGDEFNIKLTSFKIIISAFLRFLLSSHHISIGKERYKNYSIDIQVYTLKDILAMGYSTIPRFRYYDKAEKKMHYVDEKSIREQIDKLTKSYLATTKSKNITSKEEELLARYSNIWWNKYCEFINTHYYDIRHLFEFYQGVSFKFIVCKSIIESNSVDTKSGLVMYEFKSATDSGLNIEIDKQVHDLYFFKFDNSYSALATLGYTPETIELNDSYIKHIEESIEMEVNNELLDIIRISDNDGFFDALTNLVIGLHGYNKYKFDSCYIKRELTSDEPIKIEVIKYTKAHEVSKEEIQLTIENSPCRKMIFVHEGLFLSSLKREFLRNEDVILLDADDLFRKLKYMLNESILSTSILNDFIKPIISKLQFNGDKIRLIRDAEVLIGDIKKCLPGIENWKEYESICYRAIRYLFEDSFTHFQAEYQISNDIRTDIRDLIILNSGNHEFWKDMKLIYKSNNVVIEFKNYSDSIGNDSFRQISDYLEKDVYGQFGLIFTRKELDANSRRKQIDYLRNSTKKLILVISDANLIDMISLKSKEESPESVLMNLKFSLETSV